VAPKRKMANGKLYSTKNLKSNITKNNINRDYPESKKFK